jgi:8-oxo-dGTP pyrophosphatase MutT (NUDIX family)
METRKLARLVSSFHDDGDPAAGKSQELVLQLLEHTPSPFSRAQFIPGHITGTGLVLHPTRDAFLLVEHLRLNRWLLPGGHVETQDQEIWDTARREVIEETGVQLVTVRRPELVGIDVHGIPPSRREPFHLHHDLIFGFRAASPDFAITDEVRAAAWCAVGDWEPHDVPLSIRLSVLRALSALPLVR